MLLFAVAVWIVNDEHVEMLCQVKFAVKEF